LYRGYSLMKSRHDNYITVSPRRACFQHVVVLKIFYETLFRV